MEEHFGTEYQTECETETPGTSEAENLKSVVSEDWKREEPRHGLRSSDHPVCEQQIPSLEEGGG